MSCQLTLLVLLCLWTRVQTNHLCTSVKAASASEECQTSNPSSAYTHVHVHVHVHDSTDVYTYWTILGTLNGTLKRRLLT